jgi:hypothetical protein
MLFNLHRSHSLQLAAALSFPRRREAFVYSEKVHGPFRKPQIEKESIFKSIAGSVLNPLENVWEFILGKECTVFYSGSVAQPEG